MSERAVEYAAYRLEGYSDREAGRRAGYSKGKAPPSARKLYEKAEGMSADDPAVRKQKLQQDIAKLEFQLQEKQRKLEALEALERV